MSRKEEKMGINNYLLNILKTSSLNIILIQKNYLNVNKNIQLD